MSEENEITELIEVEEESTALTVSMNPMLTVTPDEVKIFQKNLTLLKESVLKHGVDYKIITINNQQKTIFYRSGWEKIAFFFKISTKIIDKEYREYERQAMKITRHPDTDKIVKKEPMFDKEGNPLMQKHYAYEVTVRASCGQMFNDAIGACSTDEDKRFHHPMHDIYATGHTRAKGRAICAMIGAGLSFEEIASVKQIKRQDQKKTPTQRSTPDSRKIKPPLRTR